MAKKSKKSSKKTAKKTNKPKKTDGLIHFIKEQNARKERQRDARKNPGGLLSAIGSISGNPMISALGEIPSELFHSVLPALGAFSTNKLSTNMLGSFIASHVPFLGKHARPLTALLTTAISVIIVDKIEFMHKFKTPVVIGSGLGLLHTAIGTYLPKWAWLVGAGRRPVAAAQIESASTDDGMIYLQPHEDDDITVMDHPKHTEMDPLETPIIASQSAVADDDFADLADGPFAWGN